MEGLPLHPAVVHLPLGLAMVMPVLAIAGALAIWKGWIDKKAWYAVVLVQALLFGGALFARETGEEEEEVVEEVVSEHYIEEHEEKAETFTVLAGVTLAASAIVIFVPAESIAVALMGVTVLLTLVTGAMGLNVGHSGGELVYGHNAGAAYKDRVTVKPGHNPGKHDEDDDEHE